MQYNLQPLKSGTTINLTYLTFPYGINFLDWCHLGYSIFICGWITLVHALNIHASVAENDWHF